MLQLCFETKGWVQREREKKREGRNKKGWWVGVRGKGVGKEKEEREREGRGRNREGEGWEDGRGEQGGRGKVKEERERREEQLSVQHCWVSSIVFTWGANMWQIDDVRPGNKAAEESELFHFNSHISCGIFSFKHAWSVRRQTQNHLIPTLSLFVCQFAHWGRSFYKAKTFYCFLMTWWTVELFATSTQAAVILKVSSVVTNNVLLNIKEILNIACDDWNWSGVYAFIRWCRISVYTYKICVCLLHRVTTLKQICTLQTNVFCFFCVLFIIACNGNKQGCLLYILLCCYYGDFVS